MAKITGSIFSSEDAHPVEPRTTVICAVWHKDPKRHQLLRGHQSNLNAQSVPVERIYVFDGGDASPADLAGRAFRSDAPLTIYQAWNLALAKVATPYVMNLNLDDRLCTDAVARLAGLIEAKGAGLTGGDWRNCFDRETTDAVGPCLPLDSYPISKHHPARPADGPSRLGCGSARRTFGPACLWRMSLHEKISRYPMTAGDGTPIRTVGDSIWWHLLRTNGVEMVRLNLIVGHYHSHPAEQAEFRYDNNEEFQRVRRSGVKLV